MMSFSRSYYSEDATNYLTLKQNCSQTKISTFHKNIPPVNLPIIQQRCQTSLHLHIISTPSCTLYFASEETVQKKSQNSLSFILFFARHVLTLQTKSKKTKNDVRN